MVLRALFAAAMQPQHFCRTRFRLAESHCVAARSAIPAYPGRAAPSQKAEIHLTPAGIAYRSPACRQWRGLRLKTESSQNPISKNRRVVVEKHHAQPEAPEQADSFLAGMVHDALQVVRTP